MSENHISVGRYISVLYRWGQSYIACRMKPYNIGRGQHAFLIMLYEHDGISQEELSRRLLIDKGTTARAIDKLEREGYVYRKRNPEDRRAYNVFITDKAREVQPILYKTLASLTDIFVMDLNENERDMLHRILKKMHNNTKMYMKQDL